MWSSRIHADVILQDKVVASGPDEVLRGLGDCGSVAVVATLFDAEATLVLSAAQLTRTKVPVGRVDGYFIGKEVWVPSATPARSAGASRSQRLSPPCRLEM
jgi:hypothetical protein